jgi:SagB-type dehydrogenase family enzyme
MPRVGNRDDLTPARTYHEATKHTFVSVRTSGHRLDWENRPRPFKEYRGIEAEAIPADLTRLLRTGAGVSRSRTLPGGDVYHFRTYASAGALYPVEVYVVTADGVFHFHPGELALRRLRAGDFRAFLGEPDARAVLVLTGILWRTAWKYGPRGYRHLFWDAGTMLANLLALAAEDEPRLVTGFVDEDANRVLGVDGRREAALALLALGRSDAAGHFPEVEPLDLDVAPLARSEPRHPEAEELHAASVLASGNEVERYRGDLQSSPVVGVDLAAGEPLDEVIRRRGSARHFSEDAIASLRLAAILAAASAPIPADVPPVTETHLIANAVTGIETGAYRFRPPDRFELLRRGSLRGWAGYLALEQEHGARAAATQFLLADLEAVLAAHGNRGYRWAQLEAGIRAGRMYLAAYARGLGATGLTFYDDDVARFFTGETERQPMLCVAVGPERPLTNV